MTEPIQRPSAADMRVAHALLRPWYALASPVFFGMEDIPDDGPLMFVGNHTLYGILDVPFLFVELYRRRQMVIHGMGDHLHFKLPGWRELLTRFGVVPGTRDECGRLLEAGEHVLVFPGGAREVAKRKGERYQLIWKDRVGFAKLAIAHQATVIPFASVGVDDAFEIAWDADEIWASQAGPLLERAGVRRAATLPVPRRFQPERLYYHFGAPIPTDSFAGRSSDRDAALALRARARAGIEDSIAFLLEARETDPERHLRPRLRNAIRRILG